jgi:hypothetical protein
MRRFFGIASANLRLQKLDSWGDPGRQQYVGILLDEKLEYTAHVEALGARRGAPRDQFRRYRTTATLRPA